jgi:hypothetical protein
VAAHLTGRPPSFRGFCQKPDFLNSTLDRECGTQEGWFNPSHFTGAKNAKRGFAGDGRKLVEVVAASASPSTSLGTLNLSNGHGDVRSRIHSLALAATTNRCSGVHPRTSVQSVVERLPGRWSATSLSPFHDRTSIGL